MTQNKLNINVEDHDPIARQLIKYRFTPVKFGILIFVLNILVDGSLGAIFGVFTSHSNHPGILQDPVALSFDFLIQPIICGAYLWSALASNRLFLDIQTKGVIKSINTANNSVKGVINKYQRYHFYLLALIIGIIFAIAQAVAYFGKVPWDTFDGYLYINPYMSFARLPFWFFTFYGIAYGIFNISITSSVLESIFKTINNININLLHPDKCGGLSMVGNYASKTGYIIIPIGVFASVSALLQKDFYKAYPIHLFILIYILISPLVFTLPIWKAHIAMEKKKEQELLKLADQFQQKYQNLTKSKKLINEQHDLENLQKLYLLISSNYPTWPFRFENVRRFTLSVTSPLLPILLSIAIDILTKSLT
jgi:hypothetical protein